MKPIIAGAAIPLLVLTGAFAALAQTTPPTTTTPSATTPSTTKDMSKYVGQQAADEWRSSKVVGLNVYNAANEKVGDINDIILGQDGKAEHAIVGVGGFLGINEKNVAIPFADLKFRRDTDGSVHVMVDSTKDALQGAPNYKFYQDRG